MPTLTDGQKLLQEYEDLGFDDADINAIKEKRSKAFIDGGGNIEELDAFWGDTPGVGEQVFTNLAKDNLRQAKWEYEKLPTADPKNWKEVLAASFGMSVFSLSNLGRRPTKQIPASQDMTWASSFANAAGVIGDVPAMALGAVTALPAFFAGPVAGGAAVGANMMAIPEALRQGYLYTYTESQNASTKDVLYGMTQAPGKIAIAAATGAAGGMAGSIAYKVALKVASPLVSSMTANVAGEIAATGVNAGLNQQMPTMKDFTVSAVLMAMLPGAHYNLTGQFFKKVGARARTEFTPAGEAIVSNVQKLWTKTGVKPMKMVQIVEVDKVARQSILGTDVDGAVVTDTWDIHRQPEPEPYKSKVIEKEGPVVIGAVKGSDDGMVDQLTTAGKMNPETGIAPVKSVNPDQLEAIADVDVPLTPEQTANLKEAASKYKNADGSIDLEAVLIDHDAGEAAAKVFRASGRDYSTLNPRTQRFLEYVGERLDRDGYAPEPKEGARAGGPPAVPPKDGGGLVPSPEPGKGHFPRNFELVAEDINANVTKSTTGDKPGDYWRAWKAGWREFAPIAELDKMVGYGRKYGEIGIEMIARLQKSSDDRFMLRISKGGGGISMTSDKFGNPAYEVLYHIPTFHSIINGARKLKHGTDGWIAYMIALTTLDRQALGLKTTTTLELAQEAIAAVPKKEKKIYEKLAKDYQAMMGDSLYGVNQHGGISEEGINKFLTDHPNYFPQQVHVEPSMPVARKGIGKIFRKAKGHEKMLKDTLQSTLEMLQKRERFNNANLVRLKTVETLQKYFESEAVDVVPPKMKETIAPLDENGNILTAMEEVEFFKYNPHEIVYYDDGVKTIYKVPDFPGREIFLQSLLNGSTFDNAVAIRGLQTITRFTRELIVNMPSYMWRMVVRDSYQHAVFSKYGGVTGFNLIRGAFDMVGYATGKGDLSWGKRKVDEAMANGAWVGGIQRMDINALKMSMNELENTGTIGAMINVVRNPLDFLHKATRMMDATVRIGGTYTGAREAFGPLSAADMARRLGGDFAEKSLSAVVNAAVSSAPFASGWQRAGIDALNTAVQNDPIGVGLRGVRDITIPVIAMTALTLFLEEALNIPDVDREKNRDRKVLDNFMILPVYNPANGELYKFPMPLPYGIGSLFAAPVHRMFDYMQKDDPRAFKDMIYNIVTSFVDGAVPYMDNPLVSAFLEGSSGEEHTVAPGLGLSRPIVPTRFEHMSGHNAYQPWTSEVAKALSRWVGEPGLDVADVTPVMIEHQIKNFTGTAGREALRIIDMAIKPNTSMGDWANTPFIGSFLMRHPGLNSRPITDFYDELANFRKAQGDVRIAKTRYDVDAIMKASQSADLMINLDAAAETLANMRAMSYGIMEAKDTEYKRADGSQMTSSEIADDKRQAIDNLATMMIMVAEMHLGMIDSFREATANAQTSP